GAVVARGERLHIGEAGDADGGDGGLGAAGDHHVRVAAGDDVRRVSDGVVAGGAGGGHGFVRAARAEEHAHVPGGDVHDHHRDDEGAHAVRAALDEDADLVFQGAQAADAAAD